MKHEDTVRRTIPAIINAYLEAEKPDQIERLENLIFCMYISALLVLMSAFNFVDYFFDIVIIDNITCNLSDSVILLLMAISFEAATRIKIREFYLTPVIIILSCTALLFITVKLYPIMGSAIWTFYFIFFLLALMRISRTMLACLSVTVFLCCLHILHLSSFVPSSFLSVQYKVIHITLLIFLGIIAIVYHRINANRYQYVFRKINQSVEKIDRVLEQYGHSESLNKETQYAYKKATKVQELLISQEKLAGIGQLTAGIAHEVNNSLGFICSNFETSRDYLKSYHKILEAYQDLINQLSRQELHKEEIEEIKELERKENLIFISQDMEELSDDIEDGLKRISNIVFGLKAFSKIRPGEEFEEYDLNKGIGNVIMAVESGMKQNIQIIEQLGSIPAIEANGGEINQVLLNLFINAADAIEAKQMDHSGWISLTTNVYDSFVILEMDDSGIGIEEKYVDKIFDPFFTTKSTAGRTGLGLSVTYDIIVNKHHGEISVSSKQGIGTKFKVRLPIKQPKRSGDEYE